MLSSEQNRHTPDMAFVLVLFFLFALTVFSLSAVSGGVYARTTDSMQENYQLRTALGYLSNKVRQCPNTPYCAVQSGTLCLVLPEKTADESYQTLIYLSDGWLCEKLTAASDDFDLSAGMPIVEAAAFAPAVTGGLLRISVTAPSGASLNTAVALPEVAP
ncbi:MAG: DUF4860 domain-containing protein [Eubacteriales bacterium]|nr:DUF4860 domain-containing protein [Eubacteriales bacterium]